VLEGSVRRSGDSLRFTGQLVDATSGAHIWADRFDGGISDVFKLQDSIAESVVAAIEPNVQLAEIERLKRKSATNLDAYELLLRAQQLEYEFNEEAIAAAIQYLRQALALDPSYAPAMALAAYCYALRFRQGWVKDPEAEKSEAMRLAWRAVELGHDDANVLWMSAHVIFRLGQDERRAKELVYRSLLLNPNSAIALTIAGWIELSGAIPNHTKALEMLRRAERLSPRDPRGWFISNAMTMAYFGLKQFDEAIRWAEKALNQNPRNTSALRLLAASAAHMGHLDQASATIQELRRIDPQFTLSTMRTRVIIMDEAIWNLLASGLRLAGLPE